jgi:parallel beta-helix repeat protein
MMKRLKTFSHLGAIATVALAAILLLALAAPAWAFPDVPAGHPYETAIDDLSSAGIIGGYANGNFGLTDPVKRSQFAKMIVGTLDITPPTSTATRFTDLGNPDANGYPHKYVQAAYDNGITYGTNATQTLFDPWKSIRRDQVVSMIVRGVNGLYPGTLDDPPAGTVSQFDGVPEPHGENLRIADYNGLLDGLIGMGPNWSVTATATRGEVAQILWNLLDLLGGTTPGGGDVWVYTDGSGDYPTIEAAVADVDPGTTINLGPGTFTLTATLSVDFDCSLVGNGMDGADSTTVRYAGTVVEVSDATFSAEDIRFTSTATGSASDVMDAQDADLDLQSCYFSGANRYNNVAGDGLYVYGSSTATVTDCTFTGNDLNGVDVDDDTEITLEGNTCSNNTQDGMIFWSTSIGHVSGNTCSANTNDGIGLHDNVTAVVENNACLHNVEAGIWFGDNATGSASGNECAFNHYGIAIDPGAKPTIGTNNLHDNDNDLVHL